MIPNGWEEKQIVDVIAGLEAGASVNGEDRRKTDSEIAVLKISAVTYGRFDSDAYKVVTNPSEKERLRIVPTQDSILISRANTLDLVGASAYISKDYPDLFLPDKLWKLTSSENHSAEWLSHILATRVVRTHISNRATGTSGSMKNISQEAFLSIRIPVPPLAEQRKIAAIRGTWDAAIAAAERLVAALRARKRALMQRLLTGEVRFPGFEGEWKIKRFGDVFERITRKNSIRNTNVLTASGQHGLVSQTDYFNRSVAGAAIENYYLIKRGEFAYNRSSSEGYLLKKGGCYDVGAQDAPRCNSSARSAINSANGGSRPSPRIRS